MMGAKRGQSRGRRPLKEPTPRRLKPPYAQDEDQHGFPGQPPHNTASSVDSTEIGVQTTSPHGKVCLLEPVMRHWSTQTIGATTQSTSTQTTASLSLQPPPPPVHVELDVLKREDTTNATRSCILDVQEAVATMQNGVAEKLFAVESVLSKEIETLHDEKMTLQAELDALQRNWDAMQQALIRAEDAVCSEEEAKEGLVTAMEAQTKLAGHSSKRSGARILVLGARQRANSHMQTLVRGWKVGSEAFRLEPKPSLNQDLSCNRNRC